MKNENAVLANLFTNLKGSKQKNDDWITIAKTCQKILKNNNNDRKVTAQKLGVSPELIRSIVSLLKLPDPVQQLIKDRKILLDAAQRINTIKIPEKKKRESKQIQVAQIIVNLPSHEQREIIQFAKKFPDSDIKNYKKRVMTPRETKNMHVLVVTLEENPYKILQKKAKQKKVSTESLVQKIILGWTEGSRK